MPTPTTLFATDDVGRMMKLQQHELSRYEFEIWFEYTRASMDQVREGAMLAVQNFATHGEKVHLSVLEVTALEPVHYALGDNPTGYPGFVMEAARNAAQDWTSQEYRSEEDTTIIRCTAIPTNIEFVQDLSGSSTNGPKIQSESNMPMIGADVRLLSHEMTERVVNRDMDKNQIGIAPMGKWIRDDRVKLLVSVEDLLKVHFGIFGFTGAGKSNLVSTMIADVLPQLPNSKVVLFDLMGEYGTLLIDRLNEIDDTYIICLGERSLPEPVFRTINQDRKYENSDLRAAANHLVNFFLLPKDLVPHKRMLIPAYMKLIQQKKIRVFSDAHNPVVDDVCDTNTERNPWAGRTPNRGPYNAITTIVRYVFGRYYKKNTPLTSKLAASLKTELEQSLEGRNAQYRTDFDNVIRYLDQIARPRQVLHCAITLPDILDILDTESSSLIIVISHDPSELRRFSQRLGENTYERRRQTGRITPIVSFIFDEADEFIPREASGSYADSKAIAETLARRGRKFGLGLGIATQRIRYLDTNIMAQPHTYFVSKLPRRTDRTGVADAFGISDEMLRATFTFQPGNWLLVSHDATGLRAVPVPISAANANDRIIKYLQNLP